LIDILSFGVSSLAIGGGKKRQNPRTVFLGSWDSIIPHSRASEGLPGQKAALEQAVGQVVQRDHGISSLGDTENLTEQGPKQPDQTSELDLCCGGA